MQPEVTQNGESPLFSSSAISLHLRCLGYPEKSLNSLLRCGEESNNFVVAQCGCGVKTINMKHKCNLRTCSECSKRRKRRIRRKYLPLLNSQKADKRNFLYFLTISPQNYTNDFSYIHTYPANKKKGIKKRVVLLTGLEAGLAHIRDSFVQFMRLQYVKDRIKAGLYVIESKQSVDGSWNIHIHSIVYGRWLDNRIRGLCLECGQNLMKFDYNNKKYYCASRSCNSTNVIVKEDSKIVSLWRSSSKREVNMHITRQSSTEFTLNYMLKYISSNKEDFQTPMSMASYIFVTRKKRLINSFGTFISYKPPKEELICPECGEQLVYIFDIEIMELLRRSQPPPDFNLITSYI